MSSAIYRLTRSEDFMWVLWIGRLHSDLEIAHFTDLRIRTFNKGSMTVLVGVDFVLFVVCFLWGGVGMFKNLFERTFRYIKLYIDTFSILGINIRILYREKRIL